MQLTHLHPRTKAKIIGYADDNELTVQRLIQVGFVLGDQLEIVQKGRIGHEPVVVEVRHQKIGLGANEANLIHVQLEDDLS